MKLITSLFSLLIVIAIFSCDNNSVKETSLYYSHIIKNNKGIIRGAQFNENIKQIKKHERKKALITDTETILEYEYDLKDRGTYIVTYQFDKQGCYEIDLDLYLSSNTFVVEAQNTLSTYFNDKYGTPTEEDNLLIWKDEQKTTTVELDYLNKAEGEIMLTIFANE